MLEKLIGQNFKISQLGMKESAGLREFEDPVRVVLLLVTLSGRAG